MTMIQYLEKGPDMAPTGHEVTSGGNLAPLCHADLLELTLVKAAKLKLRLQNCDVTASSIQEIPIGPPELKETTIDTSLLVSHESLHRQVGTVGRFAGWWDCLRCPLCAH